MTDAERNDEIVSILDEAVAEMTSRGLLADEAAAWRALIVTALETLPGLLCRDHLRSDLTRFHNWLGHDLAELRQDARQTH